jgi:hypothetical protein
MPQEPAVFEAHIPGHAPIVTTQRLEAGETVESCFLRHITAVVAELGG